MLNYISISMLHYDKEKGILKYFSSRGGGGVILSLCRVWGPQGIAPTQRPHDASSKN